MVEDRLTDGRRVAELLSSELDGREDGELASLAVVDANPDVEPTTEGALAYRVERDGDAFASVFVHPDRVSVEFEAGLETAVETARDVELRVRPKDARPPRTLLFVEDGGEVKRAVDVVDATASAAGS